MNKDHTSQTDRPDATAQALPRSIAGLVRLYRDNPIAMCFTDHEAHVLHANPAFLAMLHPQPELGEILGQPLSSLLSHQSRRVSDYLTALIDDERSLTLHKTLHLGEQHNPTAMQIHVQSLPSAEGEASDGAWLTFQQDSERYQAQLTEDKQLLTERIRQLSTDLMDRQSLLKAMMDHSPFGIALMDNQRRVIQLNRTAESILGIPRNQARGILCENLFRCFEHEQRCPILEGGHNIDQEETCCAQPHKANNTFLRSAVRSRERNEEIIIEAFLDITEMKGAQKAQQDAYRAKDDFFAKMSHELRTPLNAVIGYSELLSDDNFPLEPAERKEYLGAIQRGGYDLLHLVDQVLEIARIDENKTESNPYAFRPEVLLAEINSTAVPLAAKNDNHYNSHCATDVGTVYADPEHLRAILLNLLSNACKFTQLGEVSITVKRIKNESGEWVQFAVRDTGIGLSEEQTTRVFNRFEQADNSATRSFGGSGLGLSIVKELAQLMGGYVEVSSKLDVGSTFTVSLPGKPPE